MCADLLAVEDIHVITGTMKLYLRELPIPLLTFDAYDLCLIAARTGSLVESLEMLRVALTRLPPAHYNTLRHLMRHLNKLVLFLDTHIIIARALCSSCQFEYQQFTIRRSSFLNP